MSGEGYVGILFNSKAEFPFAKRTLGLDDGKLKAEKLEKRVVNHEHSINSKSRGGGPCQKPDCETGDIVYVKSHGSKHEVRNPFIVTGEGRKDD